MATLLLNRSDVARCTNATSLIGELREALRTSDVPSTVPVRTVRATWPGLGEERDEGTEILNVFAGNGSGLQALLEVSRLRMLQQALVGALAVEVLSLPSSASVALIGAASEASVQLKSLRLVRSLSSVRIFDADFSRAASLASRLFLSLSLPAHPASTLEEAVTDADIVLITRGGAPALVPGMLREGCHVNALAHPSSLSPPLLSQVRLFTDVRANVERWAVGRRVVPLVDVLTPGWRRGVGISLFVASDPPLLDEVGAWHVLQAAEADDRLTRFEFVTTV